MDFRCLKHLQPAHLKYVAITSTLKPQARYCQGYTEEKQGLDALHQEPWLGLPQPLSSICPRRIHTQFQNILQRQFPSSGTSFHLLGLGSVFTILKTSMNMAQVFTSAGLQGRPGGAGTKALLCMAESF